jgi:hypothetical protein
MLKKNQLILGLLIIAVFAGITAVAVLVRASGGGGTPMGQIAGAVSYPVANWQHDPSDKVVLFDSTASSRIDSVLIQGGGGKYWYNMLTPPRTGHYYVQGIGEHCCSVQYYVYWEEDQYLEQDIVMDQPNEPQK